ncbi:MULTISPECIES: hypothetical protein [Kitasatospora]|uniref:CcoQ/FixQ family Cbb3-type cytochrome c oxidase assembly chaperone n=1 Tax=Kitasatospora arboriphila TaxID=258052 RepID=A0ABN1TTQ3_9ACTN|nr:hypothetical protein [Kitasatospora sp. DSM 101779]MCU7823089.1 hypothetical protein [Kitasatospora sp. DSM 101779]
MSTPVNLTHLAADLALDQNKVTPGLLGFVVFAALGIATWFLLKSMNSRFKKIDFVEEPETTEE